MQEWNIRFLIRVMKPVQRLLKISRSMEMFQTADEDIVAMIEMNGRISPEKITSEKYKEWLIMQYTIKFTVKSTIPLI